MPVIKPVFVTFILLFLIQGCTAVKPWQRDYLARDAMQWGVDPLKTALDNHIYFSKEASTGGNSAAGGGCGCN